jgi:DNA primase
MASYSTAVLDDIRAAVDIVDLVGRYVNLRKAGANFKGLCPFHGEKTPSFNVNPKKGIFHCFGCGVGGDAFNFLMLQDKLSFPEAVRALAKTTGVALPEERAQPGDSGREELHRVMALAARFYAEALWKPGGERAQAYLAERGIDPEVARRFGLGYAPEGWEALLSFMKGERVGEDIVITTGLAIARDNRAGAYDRFRGRLLFAIRDMQSRVVAFGGRAFGDEQPKYLNSPETPLYTKGNLLYAADLARESIQTRNRALIVEGYVDCLMAHQHGFTETVAALGTAFTAAQLGVLRRYCDQVVTFFDADAAGQKAAERAEELLEPSGGGIVWGVNRSGTLQAAGTLRVKVALLPAGHDPDTFLRAEGAAAFEARITAARSLLSYALDRSIAESSTSAGPRARANAFARAALMLAKVTDAQEATALSREAALKLGVDATQLWIEAQRLSSALRKPAAVAGVAVGPSAAPGGFERDLVTLLLASHRARTDLLPIVERHDFTHEGLWHLVAALQERPQAAAEALMTDLTAADTRGLLAALLVEERPAADEAAMTDQFRRRLERGRRLRHMREIGRSLAEQHPIEVERSLDDTLVALHQESAGVYEFGGGIPQSLERRAVQPSEHGPEGPQGVQGND